MNDEFPTLPAEVETCVIGSGLGGLSIAAALDEAGADYLVLDKGRTPGGRAATRRFADSRFDHGLPFVTDKGPLTRAMIERGEGAGLLRRMDRFDGHDDGWFSPAGISALGKHMAAGLRIRNQARVTSIEADGTGLTLKIETGEERVEVRIRTNLIVTAPLPQAIELLAPLAPDWNLPGASPYDEAVVAMVRVDPSRLSEGPAHQLLTGGNGILVRDYLKFADVEPGVSLRFSPALSRSLFDREEEEIVAAVRAELETMTGPLDPAMVQVMRWRYANGAGTIMEPFLETTVAGVRIRVCGDSFLAGQADGTEASLASCRAALDSLS